MYQNNTNILFPILVQKYSYKNHKDFKLGSKEFGELSKNLGSDEEDEQYNPGDYKSKKGPKINVKKTKW